MTYDSENIIKSFAAGKYNEVYNAVFPFAKVGVPDAQCMLGMLYQLGLGTDQDGSQAVFWYEQAASQGHPVAFNNLGTLYLHGIPGVPPDRDKAIEYYLKAHAAGFDAMDLTSLGVG